MEKTLLDILFRSERRKDVLIMLKDGSQKMDTILRSLDTTRESLRPQIKVLEDHHLVKGLNDIYELTPIGELIVGEMASLIGTVQVFDNNIEYWGAHNLDSIPRHLLKQIDELKTCSILEPSLTELFEVNKDFIESAMKSSSVCLVTTFMHPTYPWMLSQLTENDINVSMIISKDLYIKLKIDLYDQFKHFISVENIKFYLYQKDMEITSLAISDYCFFLRLLYKNNEFSNKQLFGDHPQSYQWSKDLFEYYLKDSTPITEL
ncbi:MAG: winged helix-turn-helix domain-containing protein [Methanolobus sp.]|nr:winged helix-turn-helix domain-containing protein [Methanolobus sp.]